jgi:hypothetical protein
MALIIQILFSGIGVADGGNNLNITSDAVAGGFIPQSISAGE